MFLESIVNFIFFFKSHRLSYATSLLRRSPAVRSLRYVKTCIYLHLCGMWLYKKNYRVICLVTNFRASERAHFSAFVYSVLSVAWLDYMLWFCLCRIRSSCFISFYLHLDLDLNFNHGCCVSFSFKFKLQDSICSDKHHRGLYSVASWSWTTCCPHGLPWLRWRYART